MKHQHQHQHQPSNQHPDERSGGQNLPTWKRFSFLVILLLSSIILTVGVIELSVRFYAYEIALQGRLFQTDLEFGYSHLPNIVVRRRNTDGTIFTIATNDSGRRVSPDNPNEPLWREGTGRRVLIVGDSFAEGQVNIEDRMDRVMERIRPEWATAAIGVSGYGTGQQVALAGKYYGTLRRDDVVLILTCGNDFHDLVMRWDNGRAKSFVTLEKGQLVENPPELGLGAWLRDRSFLAGFLILRLNPRVSSTDAEKVEARRLYRALVVREAARLEALGLRFLVVHHSDQIEDGLEAFFRELAGEVEIPMLALDDLIGRTGPDNPLFIPQNSHWNTAGNLAVAHALIEFIDAKAGP